MKIGDKVQVFDRYNHAIPVYGEIFAGPAEDGSFGVRLETTNNPMIQIGTERWYFAVQLAPVPINSPMGERYIAMSNMNERLSRKLKAIYDIVKEAVES